MATGKELLDAQFVIISSRYNFKTISANWNEAESTWSDYICRIAKEIQKGTYHG